MAKKEKEVEEIAEEEISVFQEEGAPRVKANVKDVPLEEIYELENVRQVYHGIEELAETMHMQGQLQPCLIRPALDSSHGKPYELVFGYRRKKAAEYLHAMEVKGWDKLRCQIQEVNDGEQLSKMIVENFQREKPSPVSEARAMQKLKYSQDPPLSNAEVGRRLGLHRSQVAHRLSILSLGQVEETKSKALPAASAESTTTTSEPANNNDSEERTDNEDGPMGNAEPTQEENVVASVESTEESAQEENPEESQVEAKEEKKVDILQMVDTGEISAATAEVIATLESREDQEKLATLAKRHDWGSRRARSWAKEAQKQSELELKDENVEISSVDASFVTELPQYYAKDLNEKEKERVKLYIILRQGMDGEMLEWLDSQGYSYHEIWDYVRQLDNQEVPELQDRLMSRFLSAAHRYHAFEASLIEDVMQDDGEVPEASGPDYSGESDDSDDDEDWENW